MKGMPFDFQGKGVLDLDLILQKNKSFLTKKFNFTDFSPYFLERSCISETSNSNSFGEPKSVLDSARFPNRPTSSSTPSSSHGGGSGVASAFGGGGGASSDTTNPSPKWHQQQDSATATSCSNILATAREESLNAVVSDNVGGGGERLVMEDWESVLSDVSRAGQEQSVLRWIMGEDSNMGAPSNKVIELGGGGNNNALEFDFNYSSGGFGVVDQESFGLSGVNLTPNVPILDRSSLLSSNLIPNLGFDSCSLETKPPELSSQLLVNQYQAQRNQNSSLVLPPPYTAQHNDENLFLPPQSKRHNPGFGVTDSALGSQISKGSYSFNPQSNHLHNMPHQIQFLPHFEAGPVKFEQKPKIEEDVGQCNQQQSIVDQLYKAAELVQVGNLALAQEILARLNHQLSSPFGKPLQRAAFYCKEALQKLLLSSNNYGLIIPSMVNSLPFGPAFKIGAYKLFSEISPVVQFANFTCNQAILEALEGFDRVHVIDFDIGYGGQWASLMQELALRNGGGSTSLKITVLPSPTSSLDQLELGLTRESLIQFANETKIAFDFDVLGFDSLNPGSWASHFRSSEEAIVVNLPVGVLANGQELSVPSILRFVKQLSPRIIVSVDRGCDRSDLAFANHMMHALQAYSNLLESLDAVDVNADSLHKIERFLLQPGIERIVTNRFRNQVKTQHWRALFLSYGFSAVNFSNFTESQAECITKRTPVRGFTVEKRQCSLVLCWQRKELISASAWRC